MRRLWGAPWWAHALAYGALLVALLPALHVDTPFSPDEGLYAVQVRTLEQGSWAYDYPHADIDPEGRWFPLENVTRVGSRWYPYVGHPAYVWLLRLGVAVAGDVNGLVAPSLLGALLAALAAWWLAIEVGRPAIARAAFWVTAFGPVLANASVMWAHAPAAALGGAAAALVVRVVRRGPSLWVAAGLATVLAAMTLVRSEGLLFAAAVGAVLGLAGLRRGGVRTAVGSGAPALAAVVAVLAERSWITSITGSGSVSSVERGVRQQSGSFLAGRVEGALHILVDPSYDSARSTAVGLVGLGLLVGAVYVHRRGPAAAARVLPVLLGAVIVVFAGRVVTDPDQAATGLFAAWPALVVGLGWCRWRGLPPGLAAALVVVGAFGSLVLATQYTVGGGLEWGGRFLAPALPVLGVVVALALTEASGRRGVRAALLGLVALSAAAAPVAIGAKRAGDDAQIEQIAAAGGEVIVTHEEVLPRYGWRIDPPAGWLVVPDDDLAPALRALRASGAKRVTAVVPFYVAQSVLGEFGRVEARPAPDVDRFGWRLYVLDATNGSG